MLHLAPIAIRGEADLQEAVLRVTNVGPEIAITGKLLTRSALAPFSCEDVVTGYGKREDPEKTREQDPDQAVKDDDKTSVGGASSLNFNFLDEDEEGTETLAGRTEPAKDEISTMEPPSAFKKAAHNLPESSSPGKIETTRKKLLTESPRRREKEGAARVPFLGTLPEEE